MKMLKVLLACTMLSAPTMAFAQTGGPWASGEPIPANTITVPSFGTITGLNQEMALKADVNSPQFVGVVGDTVAPSGTLSTPSGLAYTPLGIYVTSTSDNASGGTTDVSESDPNVRSAIFRGLQYNFWAKYNCSLHAIYCPHFSSNPYRFYVGNSSYVSVLTGDNGTGGTPAGDFEAGTDQILSSNGATNLFALVGREISDSAATGSSVKDKVNLILDNFGNDTVAGSVIDSWIWTYAYTGSVGRTNWLEMNNPLGVAPIIPTGTVMDLSGGYTIGNFVQLNNTVITGHVLSWNNNTYRLEGNGNAALNAIYVNGIQVASAGGINFTGTLPTGTPTLYACFSAGQPADL